MRAGIVEEVGSDVVVDGLVERGAAAVAPYLLAALARFTGTPAHP